MDEQSFRYTVSILKFPGQGPLQLGTILANHAELEEILSSESALGLDKKQTRSYIGQRQ